MSVLRTLPRPRLSPTYASCLTRGYAAKLTNKVHKPKLPNVVSSCPANTLFDGLNYLKGQPPVTALPDEEYPPWLWTLLQPRVDVDEGPGSVAEQRRMKAERKANIKYANFLKTQ